MAPIAMVMAMCTMPGQSVGVAAFNRVIREELQLSASQFAGAYALGTVLASLLLPLTGAVMDRIGIRRTAMLIVPAFCGACFFTSQTVEIFSLLIAFFLIRFLGQGSLSLCSQNTLAMWFDRRLGRVSGVTSTFVTLFMAACPLGLRSAIEQFGWRATYRGLGVAVALILLPLLFVFRNRPEDVGQSTDGIRDNDDDSDGNDVQLQPSTAPAAPVIEGLTLAEAMRQSSYWILIGLNIVWSMVGTSLIFDVQTMGQSMVNANVAVTAWGNIPVDAANTFFFLAVGLMNLVGGFLADRYPLTRLLRFALIGMLAGLLMLTFGSGSAFFAAYAVYGSAQGLLSAVSSTIWPRLFGRAHLGKIRGGALMAMVAGSSLGPLLMGLVFDQTGTYRSAIMVYATATAIGVFAVSFLRSPIMSPNASPNASPNVPTPR